MARTGTVQMEPSRVELSMAVEEVLFEQRELLAERGVRVDVEADLPAVWCNPCRVKQVLTNLVRNAVRHGCDPREPRITIARYPSPIRPMPASSGSAFTTMARAFRSNRGKKFSSLADGLPAPIRMGSGMGLSIVRKIVQHYGGQVFVAPESGAGTMFVLSLPSATKSG